MKKIFIAFSIILFPVLTLANWSEPSGIPPANNVPAPINIGNVRQNKNAVIGATGFCIGTYCLGSGTGGSNS